MGMCYLPDGTGEMIFDVYGAWRVVEEKCGSDIVSEIQNSIEEETADREIDVFNMIGYVRTDIDNLISDLRPFTEKGGVTGKIFNKIVKKLEKMDLDLDISQERLDVIDKL